MRRTGPGPSFLEAPDRAFNALECVKYPSGVLLFY